MKERLKFSFVQFASLEDSLKWTPEERIKQNDLMVNRLLALEAFMERFCRSYNFIKSQYVHPR